LFVILSVIQHDPAKPEFILLDCHLRVLALKDLGVHEAPCLIAKDGDTYTYNYRINPLSTIQEHYMIRRAIDRGVSKERLARAFGVNLSSINRRINLLEGICSDAIARLQDKQFTPDVTRVLRNIKAARQVAIGRQTGVEACMRRDAVRCILAVLSASSSVFVDPRSTPSSNASTSSSR
jgi:hypothetical protein